MTRTRPGFEYHHDTVMTSELYDIRYLTTVLIDFRMVHSTVMWRSKRVFHVV